MIDSALARHGLQLTWSYEVAHLSGSLGLVEAGLGIAVLQAPATPAASTTVEVSRLAADAALFEVEAVVALPER